jgi:hypothetical protein
LVDQNSVSWNRFPRFIRGIQTLQSAYGPLGEH